MSYGFRPNRGTHQVVEKAKLLPKRKYLVGTRCRYISSFFDKLDHDWLIKFVELSDQGILKLIRKWLEAGVMKMAS